ncbi:hypothetical protein WA026_012989 [Henosepilachna vigintioctopunctata]|uniref:CCHC-type domain-containing protein n=1 Tax=Henosepilachna vigintioctopunctata TaxID=420089 RepID=A0AAW1TUW2_9CUCU
MIPKYENKLKKNSCHIVPKFEGFLYDVIKSKEELNIVWKKSLVTDNYNIVICYKCAGYNHFSNDCRNDRACFKCAGGHDTGECNTDYYRWSLINEFSRRSPERDEYLFESPTMEDRGESVRYVWKLREDWIAFSQSGTPNFILITRIRAKNKRVRSSFSPGYPACSSILPTVSQF